MVIQDVKAIVIIIEIKPGFKTNNIKTTMTKFGTPDNTSNKRCIKVSTLPPNQPEVNP